jgi:hypothetical protein
MEMDQVSDYRCDASLEPLLVGLSPRAPSEPIVLFEALDLPYNVANYGPGPLASR